MLASMENRLRRWLYRRDLAVWHAPEYRWPLGALEARTGAQPRRSDFTIWFLLERRALARANLRRPRRAEYEELARVHTPEAIAAVRADGFSGRVLVLDLDAHPPDGLAACLAGDPSCVIGSISGSDWVLCRAWTRPCCRSAQAIPRISPPWTRCSRACRRASPPSCSWAATCWPPTPSAGFERREIAGAPVLYIHWLALRNPRARFAPERPQLPGQEARPALID
jgi:hypothetical protein